MNKDMKNMLAELSVKPDPMRKDRFMRKIRGKYPQPRIRTADLILRQLPYINKWVWILSLLALLIAIWGIQGNREMVYLISALMPFVSGIAVFESFRSGMYGMSEPEGVTLVSLRGVLFTRIICVGTAHILILSTLAVILGKHSGYGFLMTGAMLTIPYLLSSILSMELERTAFGRKYGLSCMAISAGVSVLMFVLQNERNLYAEAYRGLWYLSTIILMLIEWFEIKKMFQMEEYAWS